MLDAFETFDSGRPLSLRTEDARCKHRRSPLSLNAALTTVRTLRKCTGRVNELVAGPQHSRNLHCMPYTLGVWESPSDVADGSSSGLVDDMEDVKARDGTSVLGGLAVQH